MLTRSKRGTDFSRTEIACLWSEMTCFILILLTVGQGRNNVGLFMASIKTLRHFLSWAETLAPFPALCYRQPLKSHIIHEHAIATNFHISRPEVGT